MKPAPFDYVRADSVEHATQVMAAAGGDAKVIAGGQSLMPMMNFRLVRPSVLVDLNWIPKLDQIAPQGERVRIGALVRHRMTATDTFIADRVPVLHHAMKHVAHLTVRNRGTFCGSVCHADPAAEMPMMTLLLNGEIHASAAKGKRVIAAHDFFRGSLMTALDADEVVTEITLDVPPRGTGWAFEEFARRHGDYALAAVAATVRRSNGVAADMRLAIMGVGDTPMRLHGVERSITGKELSDAVIDQAIAVMQTEIAPQTDLNGSSDYRRHLAGSLARRALLEAWTRATEAAP